MALDEAEMRQFRIALANVGRSEQDFDVSEEIDYPRANELAGVSVERSTVTVTCKKNGASRTYDAGGHGTNWIYAFEQDLQTGAFDPMSGRS